MRIKKYMIERINEKSVVRMERFRNRLVKYVNRLIGYEVKRLEDQRKRFEKKRLNREEDWNEERKVLEVEAFVSKGME